MLAKAVGADRPASNALAQKPVSLGKQLFPSSSPAATQDAVKSSPQALQQHNRNVGRPLAGASAAFSRPLPSAQLKAATKAMPDLARKRTAAQANGLPTFLDRNDSFQENTPPIVIEDDTPRNRLKQIHEHVYFDENDFDDDVNLDLDDDAQIVSKLPPRADSKVLLPGPSADAATDGSRHFPSSAPATWSSSPLHHKMTRPNAAMLQRPAVERPSIEMAEDANPRPKKTARVLPWRAEENEEAARAREPPARSGKHPGETPKTSYAWNATASAVKAEQKKLRQANKKLLVKSNEATDEALQEAISTKRRRSVVPLFLSEEQKRILDMVVNKGQSVFFTGSAGTGKSVLLREIIAKLRKKFFREPDRIAVTASTGLAACNVGGVTLHSFSGIGLGKESVAELVRKVRKNQKARTRWLRTKVLIVDEISMVDGELFDKLEGIARTIRSNGRPFGGIQLIITGDFFQLPPVPDQGKVAKFAFDAATWNTAIDHTIGLTQVFRQRDPVFAGMLDEMRLGALSQESINIFKSLNRPIHYDDHLDATELFPTRHEVDNANLARMRSLGGKSVVFEARDGGTITDAAQRTKLLSNCMAPPTLELKNGSQVMLIKNTDESLVNGSLGKVVSFMDEKTFDFYQEHECDFEAADVGPKDEGFAKKLKAMVNPDLVASTSPPLPVVRFALPDGTSRDLLCQPESWKIELPNGEVQASRTQVPLILAWALSIHKAQGQTLERVKVDLGKVFEKGQAYVALSRATCQEGLQVLRFDPRKVMAHDRVRNFYSGLTNFDQVGKKRAQAKTKEAREAKAPAKTGGGMFGRAVGDGSDDDDAEEAMGRAYG